MFGRTIRSLLLSLGLVSGAAQATLYDRGSGLIYDDVLNITWLQDANYAKTSGYDADGYMNWNDAQSWIATLNNQNYRGFSNWRLPRANPVNGGTEYQLGLSYNGSLDYGYNITSPNNELAYLYYVTLQNVGIYDTSGGLQPYADVWNKKFGPFAYSLHHNWYYWTGSVPDVAPHGAFTFHTGSGGADANHKSAELFAWAVRDGDVGPAPNTVPEPSTLALALLGLFGAASLTANRKRVPRTQPALAR